HVLDPDLVKTGRAQQSLIDTMSGEHLLAERAAAKQDLLSAQQPRHRERIGEQRPTARTQHSMPLPEHAEAFEHVVDRVNTQQRVKARRRERQRLAAIALHKPRPRREMPLPGGAVRGGTPGPVQLQTGYRAARLADHEQSRTTRAAPDVEHLARRAQPKPIEEHAVLLGRQPRVLTDVLPQRFGANHRRQLPLERAVDSIVELPSRGSRMLAGLTPTIT